MRLKKDLILLGIMAIVGICAAILTFLNGSTVQTESKHQIRITASFYPMYVLALNLTQGMDDVELDCMTQNRTGCLHDYQMTTQDMKTLEKTDVFLINGGGMESFLEDAVQNYPSLTVVDSSERLESVQKEEHTGHSHDEDEEENAHFWLNPEYYMIQIQTVADALSAFDEEHKEQYRENAEEYVKKVEEIAQKLKALDVPNTGVVVFHDAFVYLAEYLGLDVVHAVEMDSETALSAGEVAEIIQEVKAGKVSILFTEAQYSTEVADAIGKETGAASYVIDSLVTGEKEDKDAYLRGMEENLEILRRAFS